MARELLSVRELESRIKSATEEAARRNTRILIGDGDNLMLVVRPNGGASRVLKYRMAGRRNMHSLGSWPGMTLKRARDAAQAARDKIAAGVDPVEHRREERQAKQETPVAESGTVYTLFNEWLRKKRTSKIYHRNITAALEKDVLPEIGAKQVDQVTREDIVKILRKLEDRGALVMLRRVRMYLQQMWEFALDQEPPRASGMPVPTGHLKFDSHSPPQARTNSAQRARFVPKTSSRIIRAALRWVGSIRIHPLCEMRCRCQPSKYSTAFLVTRVAMHCSTTTLRRLRYSSRISRTRQRV